MIRTLGIALHFRQHLPSRSDDGPERGIQVRKEISIAMKLLGDSMGPVVWDVIGNSCSLRGHVSRQTGRKVNVHEAKGRLIAGLDLLARHWKLI